MAVASTSMGAVIGGLYCAGTLDAYTDWVTGLTQRAVIRLLDPSIKAPGLIKAEKVMSRVRELLAGKRIEELPIPFTAVATELIAQKEVWFQDGPVEAALRASIAIPSAIAPVIVDGRLLADGGLLNTVPIAPHTSARADIVIAVSLTGPRIEPTSLPAGKAAATPEDSAAQIPLACAPSTSWRWHCGPCSDSSPATGCPPTRPTCSSSCPRRGRHARLPPGERADRAGATAHAERPRPRDRRVFIPRSGLALTHPWGKDADVG